MEIPKAEYPCIMVEVPASASNVTVLPVPRLGSQRLQHRDLIRLYRNETLLANSLEEKKQNSSKLSVMEAVIFRHFTHGQTDSARAFLAAWSAACSSTSPATVHVPSGRFLLNRVAFQSPCKNNKINFRMFGTLVAPSYTVIGTSNQWILFNQVDGLSINGGILDGQGTRLWDCKLAGKHCPLGAASIVFTKSKNLLINGLTSINSELAHMVINGCEGVTMQNIKISATDVSPNTVGIHVQMSNNIAITQSTIKTGDDCISIGPGMVNLWIEGVFCGPGHGISIGSLGKTALEPGVQNVTVTWTTISGTQNGLRIKTWGRESSGFVKDVVFEHIVMENVDNPIVIDQNYCPYNRNCPGQHLGIKISNVKYNDIKGTSATPVAVKFDCSLRNPCSGITLQDINLTYKNKAALSSCTNAIGGASGIVVPQSCL
ncbi:hypothetical protein QJS10_CPA16g00055 [Acorus calamus]|uniref:Exopolygalacturonase n=1 Tax=Acorus calamus TaxID=4465 RepID=A0AAV9D2W8_ACOCL|nr:hypothetical protein QJS10_CPA16g00055 [Acorus calamus]